MHCAIWVSASDDNTSLEQRGHCKAGGTDKGPTVNVLCGCDNQQRS